MTPRPTLRDIAKIAGVSHFTVSKALRNHPKVSKETRERILKIAKEVGYQPDPMLSALIAYRRNAKVPRYQGTLAVIDCWNSATHFHYSFARYGAGVLERCRELGYQLEEFRLAEFGMRGRALSKVLRARNIQGLLFAPQQRGRAHVNFDWEQFSSVAFGFSLARPRLHVVTVAQYRCAVLAMRKLRALGYRRIGYMTTRAFDERTDHNYTAGFMIERERLKPEDHVPILMQGSEETAATDEIINRWFTLHRPEIVLSPVWWMANWFKRNETVAGKKARLVLIGTDPRQPHIPGISQCDEIIGRVAVDQVVNMIHRGERGVPKVPLRMLVEGEWQDGVGNPLARSGRK